MSFERLKRYHSYEKHTPDWRTPDVIVFDEDIEEKIDDFPAFTESQKQTIRQAMSGSPHSVRKTLCFAKNFFFVVIVNRHFNFTGSDI